MLQSVSRESVDQVATWASEILESKSAPEILMMINELVSKASHRPQICAKLAKSIEKLTSFQELLCEKCQDDFFDSTKNENVENFGLIYFIGELYNV